MTYPRKTAAYHGLRVAAGVLAHSPHIDAPGVGAETAKRRKRHRRV